MNFLCQLQTGRNNLEYMYVSHLHVVVHGIIPSGNMSKGKEERVKRGARAGTDTKGCESERSFLLQVFVPGILFYRTNDVP